MPQVKQYPTCCTSFYCGKAGDDCLTCRNYPKLKAFKEWKEKHEAKQVDHIWSRLSYISTKD